MGLSKKDQRNRDQKAADANGTRVETTAGGVAKKPAKVMTQCTVCKAPLIASQSTILRDHAARHPKVSPEVCFPGQTIAP